LWGAMYVIDIHFIMNPVSGGNPLNDISNSASIKFDSIVVCDVYIWFMYRIFLLYIIMNRGIISNEYIMKYTILAYLL